MYTFVNNNDVYPHKEFNNKWTSFKFMIFNTFRQTNLNLRTLRRINISFNENNTMMLTESLEHLFYNDIFYSL
jgi:hypothetical protein